MKIAKVNKEKVVTNVVDADGVVIDSYTETKHDKIVIDDDETFCTLFGSLIGIVDNIDKLGWKVLLYCTQNCDINTNLMNLGKFNRKLICDKYGLTDGSVRNTICKLAKTGALVRSDSSVYRVNPKYFWRGNQGERKKYILEIEYKVDAKKSKKKKAMQVNNNFENE